MRDREKGRRDRVVMGVVAAAMIMGAAWTVFVDIAPEQYAELKAPVAGMLVEERVRHIYVERGPEGVRGTCGTPLTALGIAFACRVSEERDGPLTDDWLDLYAYARKDKAEEALRIMDEKVDASTLTETQFEDLVAETAPPPIRYGSVLLGWRARLDR